MSFMVVGRRECRHGTAAVSTTPKRIIILISPHSERLGFPTDRRETM